MNTFDTVIRFLEHINRESYFEALLLIIVFNSVLTSEIDVFLSVNINRVVMIMEIATVTNSVINISGTNNLNRLEIANPAITAIAVLAT